MASSASVLSRSICYMQCKCFNISPLFLKFPFTQGAGKPFSSTSRVSMWPWEHFIHPHASLFHPLFPWKIDVLKNSCSFSSFPLHSSACPPQPFLPQAFWASEVSKVNISLHSPLQETPESLAFCEDTELASLDMPHAGRKAKLFKWTQTMSRQ